MGNDLYAGTFLRHLCLPPPPTAPFFLVLDLALTMARRLFPSELPPFIQQPTSLCWISRHRSVLYNGKPLGGLFNASGITPGFVLPNDAGHITAATCTAAAAPGTTAAAAAATTTAALAIPASATITITATAAAAATAATAAAPAAAASAVAIATDTPTLIFALATEISGVASKGIRPPALDRPDSLLQRGPVERLGERRQRHRERDLQRLSVHPPPQTHRLAAQLRRPTHQRRRRVLSELPQAAAQHLGRAAHRYPCLLAQALQSLDGKRVDAAEDGRVEPSEERPPPKQGASRPHGALRGATRLVLAQPEAGAARRSHAEALPRPPEDAREDAPAPARHDEATRAEGGREGGGVALGGSEMLQRWVYSSGVGCGGRGG